MHLQDLHLQFTFFLIEKDKIIPDLFWRHVLHSLDAIGLLGSRSLLILYDVVVQLLVKGLLRFILGLEVRQNMPFYLLLATLGGRYVLSLRCILWTVLFLEGLRLAVLLLVGLDDVSEGSRCLSLTLQRLLLRQQHSLAALHPVNTLAHIGLEAFLLTESVLRSGVRMCLIVRFGLEYVLR